MEKAWSEIGERTLLYRVSDTIEFSRLAKAVQYQSALSGSSPSLLSARFILEEDRLPDSSKRGNHWS
jgi:hypothetical protein